MSGAPENVEAALRTILSELAELDTDEMNAQKQVAVEQKCQAIHALFGGEGPDAIYPDDGGSP